MAMTNNLPTVASEAVRRGGLTVGRSVRLHRRRGPVCGSGYCQQCTVETLAGPVLACQSTNLTAPPFRSVDPMRPLGWFAERWTPWFYERRFLRPVWLQGIYLHGLRRLSGAPSLPAELPRGERRFLREDHDVVVVGSLDIPGARQVSLEDGEEAIGVYPDRRLGVVRDDAVIEISFRRLIVATGAYDVLPPVAGNDLPGVIGLVGAERYGAVGAWPPGTKIAAWVSEARAERVRHLAEKFALDLVWSSTRPPDRIIGRRRVKGVEVGGRRIDCAAFITAVPQPAIELARQAGATAALSTPGAPILVVTETPDWLEVRGSAALRVSGAEAVRPHDDAFACTCEDVRVKDVRACIEQGFDAPELVKRRTGAMTGPCQGKLCAASVLSIFSEYGLPAAPTTMRPLARPCFIADLAARD